MIDDSLVHLSRLQFATTAMYHFLFVPLTLGLSWLLVIMESVYVMTGKEIYRDMTKFWGKLFGINFALGVTTGITMEFQFGTNWAYYSHYVGDIFGVPLAIEGLMAFFLESTFVGLFFFGWQRLSKTRHLMVTFLVALGSNLSALWILIANGWMQNPVGAEFNYETMRMELVSFADIFFNPVAQVKFVHTVAAGYVTGAVFVLAVSSYFILRGRDFAFAQRSIAVASGFGLAAILSVIVLGDESGYEVGEVQKTKLAAIEGAWDTEKPPASFNLIGFPDQEKQETRGALKIPYVLGLIATRSVDEKVMGLKELIKKNESRIRSGIVAYGLLQKLRSGDKSQAVKDAFEDHKKDLGYGLLLKKYAPNVVDATEAQIKEAARNSIPQVAPMFWGFRLMVAAGFYMLFIFVAFFFFCAKRTLAKKRWLMRMALFSLPMPWIASESGWFVAEFGRQPWAIGGILPTNLATSSLTANDVAMSLISFVFFYSILLVAELFLMIKYSRLGPSSLGTGKYHYEREGGAAALTSQPQQKEL